MSFTEKEIRDLNRSMRAAQNVSLGTFLDNLNIDRNSLISDSKKSIKFVSEIAEAENELDYYDTNTLVWSDAEQTYYEYNGTTWDVYIQEFDFVRFNPDAEAPSHIEGQVYWDSTDHTFSVQTEIDNVTLQVGQEFFVRIVNKTAGTLTDGTVVYINGAQGNRPTVTQAVSTDETADRVIGVITADILINQEGYATVMGLVRGYNTSGWGAGDVLYVSSTPGVLTNVAPVAPNHATKVAVALNSTINGSIYVFVQHGMDLGNLHDVTLSSLANGEALLYDSSAEYWKNSDGSVDFNIKSSTEDNMIYMDKDNDELYLGGLTDSFNISKGGGVTLNGTGRVRQEIRIDAEVVTLGASAPSKTTRAVGASGGVEVPVTSFSNVTQQDVYLHIHAPYDMDASEPVMFHLMWIPASGWTTGNYNWKLEYLIKYEDVEYGSSASNTGTPTTISADVTPSNAVDFIETEFVSTITLVPHQMVLCHFYRDVANDNANAFGQVLFFELNYVKNSFGEKGVV